MPIKPEFRHFYPIDWVQLSAVIRFERARGRCEHCGRPHLQWVAHLGDGRWWDAGIGAWRDGTGRRLRARRPVDDLLGSVRMTYVVLATAHLNHDRSDCSRTNLAALCQRCHMIHDREEHRRQRWVTLFRRKALGDLFEGPYPAWWPLSRPRSGRGRARLVRHPQGRTRAGGFEGAALGGE